ncbi:MAG: methionine adenosyltransferase [Candidatus Micrarchaeota archaeon]|nr:methionine adenosyltransferase [Candidatus Micrarchaeota archaeon]
MAKNISISKLDNSCYIANKRTEYVERKGMGHPDSLIDGIVDETSHALSRAYLGQCDAILHHNVDKGLIIGGASEAKFGAGKITKKIEVIITGRATETFDGKRIDVNEIAKDVALSYLKKNTRFLDIENEVSFESRIAKGSTDLMHVFSRSDGVPLANDTSFGIGFAPFSDVERLVLETERYLNGKEYKSIMPAVGEDIKVMGLREGDGIVLTIAIAFVAHLVKDLEDYNRQKERVKSDVEKLAKRVVAKEVTVHVNTADPLDGDEVYLTKSGLSAEAGDDGSVGRGNRVNGLITPFRHMSLEAAAGKNPVNHIGKIYNLLATQMANSITKEQPSILECDIAILSQIGKPIDEPLNLNIELVTESGANFGNVESKARYQAEKWLEDLKNFTIDISLGKYMAF